MSAAQQWAGGAEKAGLVVLVCGGRGFRNASFVDRVLDDIHAHTPITAVIHGDASGADALARRWSVLRHVRHVAVQPDWETHGRAAGPIRNQRMLDEYRPALVVAFPGGRGTADMVRRARAAGVPIQEVTP